MEKYKIVFESHALRDLREIVRYIAEILKEPVIAERIHNSIKNQILSLEVMPYRHKLIYDEVIKRKFAKCLLKNIWFFIVLPRKAKPYIFFEFYITAENGKI